jgi:hypothetical protein
VGFIALVLLSVVPSFALDPPRRVAMLPLPGSRVLAMAVDGDTVLLGMSGGDGLLAVDASDPTAPRVAWSLDVGADVNAIAVAGGRAFLATALDDAELAVVDLPAHAVVLRWDVPGTADGVLVQPWLTDHLAMWIGTEANPDGPESYLLDFADPDAPTSLGGREALGDLRAPAPPDAVAKGYLAFGDVVARGRGRAKPELTFLAVNGASPELQVVSGLDDRLTVPDTDGDGVRRVACLGDSITFALMDKNPGSWCHALQQTVWSQALVIDDWGFLGATMTPAPTATAFAQLADALASGADLLIAAFGVNDVLDFTPEQIVDAARALDAAAAGTPIIFATPTPRYDVPDGADALARTSALLRAAFPADRIFDFNAAVAAADVSSDRLHLLPSGVAAQARLAHDRLVIADTRTFDDPCVTRLVSRRPRVTVSNLDTSSGDERLVMSGVSADVGSRVDPVADGAQLMLFGATGAILMERDVPPGAYDAGRRSGWKVNRARTVFRYGDGSHLRLRIARRGQSAWAVTGIVSGETIPVTAADLPVTGSALLSRPSGACVAMRFAGGRRAPCRLGRRSLACR